MLAPRLLASVFALAIAAVLLPRTSAAQVADTYAAVQGPTEQICPMTEFTVTAQYGANGADGSFVSGTVAFGGPVQINSHPSSDCGGNFNNQFSCSEPSIPEGTTFDLPFLVEGTAEGTITVTVTVQDPVGDPDTGNQVATLEITIACPLEGSISGLKFHDLDADGVKDDDEPGLEGWTIFLGNGSGPQGQATTGSDGSYRFQDLTPGTYSVTEESRTGWTQSYPDQPHDNVSVSPGGETTDVNFGNWTNGTISGVKFEDLNGNGRRDDGEPGISGWQISIDAVDGDSQPVGNPAIATTGSDGAYSASVSPGTYRVEEVAQDGWVQSAPADYYLIGIDSGSAEQTIDFGNYRKAAICGTKFQDVDGDGLLSEAEQSTGRLEGWTITLHEAEGNQLATTTTGPDGGYCFEDLEPGSYEVREVLQEGWRVLSPEAGTQGVSVVSGQRVQDADFINQSIGYLEVFKFEDLDADGIEDDEDPVHAGVSFTASMGLGQGEAQEITDSGGIAFFGPLPTGSYTLRETFFSSTVMGVSTGNNPTQVVVSRGDTARVVVGNYFLGTISGTKWLDVDRDGLRGDNEPVLEGFTIELRQDGATVATVTTDENGSYIFEQVRPGDYTVAEVVSEPWEQTFPADGAGHPVTLRSRGSIENVNFGNIGPLADIAVQKSAVADIQEDGTFFYTIVVSNVGAREAADVVMTDAFPGKFRVDSLSTTKDTCTLSDGLTGDELRCELGTLAPGESVTVRAGVTALEPGTTINQAVATTSSPEESTANNESFAEVIIFPVILTIQAQPSTHQTCKPDVKPLVGATTDGNRVNIVVAVTNGSETRSETVTLRFSEATRGVILPDGDGLVTITVPPEQTVTASYPWNTTGFAWENGEAFDRDRLVVVEMLRGEGAIGAVNIPVRVLPKPLVFVHGLWSNAAVWNALVAHAPTVHPGWANRVYAVAGMETGLDPGLALQEGRTEEIFSAQTIQTNSGILGQEIERARLENDACHVNLIGHSMGGLISREYIHSTMAPLEKDGERLVRNLIQLGTPNEGSACTEIVMGLYPYLVDAGGPAPINVMQLTPRYMTGIFNPRVTNDKGVPFHILAGGLEPNPRGVEFGFGVVGAACGFEELADGVVALSSALAVNTPTVSFRTTSVRPVNHIDMPPSLSIFDTFSKPIIAGASVTQTPSGRNVSGNATNLSSTGDIALVEIVDLGASASGTQMAVPDASALSLQLMYPENARVQVITPSAEVAFDSDSLASRTFVTALRFENPAPGTWEIAASGTGQAVFIGQLSGTDFSLATAEPVAVGSRVRFVATVTGNPDAVTATTFVGGQAVQTPLLDDGQSEDGAAGDGVFGGEVELGASGLFPARVEARRGAAMRVANLSVSITSATTVQPQAALPDAFVLHQNYPNPFNPQTRIAFELPADSRVLLVIHDALGREVRRLVDGRLGAGRHEVVFDALDLPSGAYHYTVESDFGRVARTLLLLREERP